MLKLTIFLIAVDNKNLGLQELEILVQVRAPNNMFTYTIVHLTFPAPQRVVRALVYANDYLAVHLLQK